MITKDKINVEWLESCVPCGEYCLDCQRYKKNVTVYGGFGAVRKYPERCEKYGLELFSGKKCNMCIEVENLYGAKTK